LVWVPAGDGLLGWPALLAAVALVAVRRDPLSLVVVGVTLVLAAKQHVAARVLPAALDVVPRLVVTGVLAAGAAATASRGRGPAVGHAIAGAIVAARLVGVLASPTVAGAERVAALPLVYTRLLADPASLPALVVAAPERDEAALALGWEAALDLGWRPRRADGVVLDVARALEARGRGGEARRLLARHPREGEVDGLLALYERTQGEPVRWRGGHVGATLPIEPGPEFPVPGYAAVELTTDVPLAHLRLAGEGWSDTPEPVTLQVSLDGAPAIRWALPGALDLGPVEAGPHRIALRFGGDRVGPIAGRGARVTRVWGEPAVEAP
ncbi:MAG: hypothetical protein ACOZNI_17220, partial [Myxococcota bacterium]